MKKFLLFVALGLGAISMSAQNDAYKKFFKVTYQGQEVENGDKINVSPNDESLDLGGGVYMTAADLEVVSTCGERVVVYGALAFTGKPNSSDFYANQEKYGSPSFCYENSYDDGYPNGTCLGSSNQNLYIGNGNVTIPEPGMTLPWDETEDWIFAWDVHYTSYPTTTEVTEYTLLMVPTEDEDASFSCTLAFSPVAGVNDITSNNDAEPVYYNLQGVKIANPESGLYIVKRGSKISKEIIRL